MVPGTHGSTYGGNALACAIGNAVLDVVLADGFLAEVREKARDLNQRLAGLVDGAPDVFETVRGEGLMVGLKCRAPAGEVVAAARAEGLLSVPAGDNTMRLLPPLVASESDLTAGVEKLSAAAARVAADGAGAA